MSTHTPGPWAIDGGSWRPWEGAIGIVNPNSAHHIAWTTSGELVPAEANARLIAAAPDMLEACQLFTQGARDAVRALNDAGIACPSSIALAAEKARAAIAKATGGSQ